MEIKGVECVGEMNKYQNIFVKCENENDDFEWLDGFDTWEEAVDFFVIRITDAKVVELETM